MAQGRPEILAKAENRIWQRFKTGQTNELQARAELTALESIFVVISREDDAT